MTIAHRLDTIRDVDTILIMDKGKVVKVGTPDELLAKIARKKNAGGGEEAEDEERRRRRKERIRLGLGRCGIMLIEDR